MKKINKQPAFSLLEVMVILLIMAVTLAATAPMISRKMSRNVGTAEEPFKFVGINNAISFNSEGRERAAMLIGADRIGNPANPRFITPTQNTGLYIRTRSQNGNAISIVGDFARQKGIGMQRNEDGSWNRGSARTVETKFNCTKDEGFFRLNGDTIQTQDAEGNWVACTEATAGDAPMQQELVGHIGFSQIGNNNFFPFFSNKIPDSEGMVVGARQRVRVNVNQGEALPENRPVSDGFITNAGEVTGVTVDNDGNVTYNRNNLREIISGKVMLGFDNSFDIIGADGQMPNGDSNIIALGRDINSAANQNYTAIGSLINTSYSNRHVVRDSVIIDNAPSHIANFINGNNSFSYDARRDNTSAIFFSKVATLSTNPNLNENITSIGSGTSIIGSGHTLIGRWAVCGEPMTNTSGDGFWASNNSVAIGDRSQARGDNCVAIGTESVAGEAESSITNNNITTSGDLNNRRNTVVIGANSYNRGGNSVVIGRQNQIGPIPIELTDEDNLASANNNQQRRNINMNYGANRNYTGNIAIGVGIQPQDTNNTQLSNSIVIGSASTTNDGNNTIIPNTSPQVRGNNSVAIGQGARTNDANRIMLGSNNHTVVIPGKLRVNPANLRDLNGRRIIANANGILVSEGGVSDIRLKNVGEKLTSGLEDIKKLEFFNYTFKDDKEQKPHVGVMAQDLQKVFPTSVTEGSDGYLRIRWDEMFYAALNAIKELDRKIIALAQDVKSFFERVDSIDIRVAQHQKALDDLKSDFADIDARLKALEE